MAEETNSVKSLFNIASIATNVLADSHEGSVIEYASVTNNVLIATIEDKLTHNEVSQYLLQIATNVYAAYYMQAVALMNNVGNVSVRSVLDRLNTKRDTMGNAKDKAEEWISVESAYQYPKFVSMDFKPANEAGAAPGNMAWAAEAPNLACGKIFNVTIENDGKSAVIPVRISINPIAVTSSMFTAMYGGVDNRNNTFINRIKRWMDGELSTLGDMIFVNDIIKEKAKILKQDKLKIVEQLEKKRLNNKISTLLTQKTSLATASTISIISKETANAVALAAGGKLTDPVTRNGIFNESGLIMMAVVDEMYEMVTLYYRGQSGATELTFRECRITSKGHDPNVMDVLKAFQMGQSPNI